MSGTRGPYVNHILRGIQEALETDAHGQELIDIARETMRDAETWRRFVAINGWGATTPRGVMQRPRG